MTDRSESFVPLTELGAPGYPEEVGQTLRFRDEFAELPENEWTVEEVVLARVLGKSRFEPAFPGAEYSSAAARLWARKAPTHGNSAPQGTWHIVGHRPDGCTLLRASVDAPQNWLWTTPKALAALKEAHGLIE